MQRIGDAKLDDWEQQLKKSSMVFNEHFKDDILRIFHGDFEVVEGVTKYEMARTLDQLAGIDLWHFKPKQGIRGVANRIQFGPKNWRTFTIRKSRASGAKTEYEKRKYAIDNEWLYPILAIQGYFDEEKNIAIGFAVAKTVDILWMIDNDRCYTNNTGKNQVGQAEFYVVNWDDMKREGKAIYIQGG